MSTLSNEPPAEPPVEPPAEPPVEPPAPAAGNPYQPPQSVAAPAPGSGHPLAAGGGYRPSPAASMASIVALSGCVATAVFAVAVIGNMYRLVLAAEGGAPPSAATWSQTERWLQYADYLDRGMYYVTAIPFLIWFHRVYQNLFGLEVTGLKYTPGWAVGSWFVPILNLYRPYQIGAECWDASNPDVDRADGPLGWVLARSASLVQFWWFLFLAPRFMWLAARPFTDSESPAKWKIGAVLVVIGYLMTIAGAVVTMQLIRRLDRRQAQRFHRLRAASRAGALAHLRPPVDEDEVSHDEAPVGPYDAEANQKLRRQRRQNRHRR